MIEGIGLGLAVMMWNYSGWDNPTTCLGETRSPGTVVPPRAVGGAAADHARLRAAGGGGARRDRPLGRLGHGLLARGGGGGRRPARSPPS